MRAEAERTVGRKLSETDLASWLMYPKVFRDYAEHLRKYDDVSLLPTHTFFNGMSEGEEIAVDIDRGKTLVIRLQGTADTQEEGVARIFFELNGQPRAIRVPKAGAATRERVRAEDGNASHLGAPMPGSVVTVSVKPGQEVKKGDPLVSLEAMKMESVIRAECDTKIKAVHVRPGDTVGAKDLLVEFG